MNCVQQELSQGNLCHGKDREQRCFTAYTIPGGWKTHFYLPRGHSERVRSPEGMPFGDWIGQIQSPLGTSLRSRNLGWKSKPYFFSTKITYLFTFSQSPFSPHRVVCDRQADREYVQGGVGGGHLSPFYLSEIFKVITNRIGVGITSPGGRYYSSHSVFFPAQSGQASTSSTQLSRGSLSVHQGWHSTWYLVTPSC